MQLYIFLVVFITFHILCGYLFDRFFFEVDAYPDMELFDGEAEYLFIGIYIQ